MGYLPGTLNASTKFDPKTDLRAGFDRFSPASLDANRPFLDLLKRVGRQENATPAQVALAWLLAQKPWIVPIPGTRSTDHLQENHGSLRVQLSAADLQQIDAGLAALTVHGGRMMQSR
jgi:aryl-alcohol dehydrogenase-like predicted oxidoreductase